MKLSEVYDHLSYGELSELSMGGRDEIGIPRNRQREVLSFINMGLTELHKRFPLKMEEIIIQQYDHIQNYIISSNYSNFRKKPGYDPHYLMDTPIEPYNDTLLKIEQIYDELGRELYLNDANQYWSVHIPKYNVIQVPYPENENAMSVRFRSNHPIIKFDHTPPEDIDVDIPYYLLEALVAYVGMRVYSTSPSLVPEGGSIDGQTMLAKFEQACARVTQLGLLNCVDESTNLKSTDNGWV